ncbi:hypothetical protein D6777_01445 [Candidatus Woesearchaeota archaeon]|nr:MAG: hypothetical protein D6777_01445 [Candidatus Woesearchaeota archaeon]
MMDYSRNWIFDQEKLRNASLTIIGAGEITNYLLLYAAGLGIGKCRVISDEHDGKGLLNKKDGYNVLNLEEKLKRINKDLNVEAVPLKIEPYLVDDTDVLIDATNDDQSKILAEKIFDNSKIKLFASASAGESYATVKFATGYSFKQYENDTQGSFPSAIIAAVIMDEVRKVVCPVENEERIEGVDYGLCVPQRFKDNSSLGKVWLYKPNVLICGAGGIGTYVALNLALNGVGFDVFDGDKIESHNLNRQLLYYDKVGEYKVNVLKQRLEEISCCQINAVKKYIDEDVMLRRYDVAICCADNWEARKVMNNYAVWRGVPLINAGVTAYTAYAEAYIPGVNRCLDCRYDLDELKLLKPQSCAEVQEANIVMNNALIGSLVAGEVLSGNLSFLANKFSYNSKLGKRRFSSVKNTYRRVKCKCTK